MLGSAEESSMGILTITPRDEAGNPISTDNLVNYVIKDEKGNPLKEWYAISDYLANMGGEMDSRYSSTDGRKVVYSSLNPVKLVRNANVFTYIAIALIVIVITSTALVVRLIVVRRRKKKTAQG